MQDGVVSEDSQCALCEYRDTKFYGQTLHVPSSNGKVYNDKFSCETQCMGHSLKVSESDHSQGCESCETGNVLLKVFSSTDTCEFTCRPGYERVLDDCYLMRVSTDLYTQSRLTVAVTDYVRSESNVHMFVVTHSADGLFVIVVGSTVPQNCRLDPNCFHALKRVSTKQQMGPFVSQERFNNEGDEGQLNATPIHLEEQDRQQLRFTVSDAELAELSVGPVGGTIELRVSLVDVVTWYVVSHVVRLNEASATAMTYATGDKQLLPLSLFEVDVALLYTLEGALVFQMLTTAKGEVLEMQMRVQGMDAVNKDDLLPCAVRTTRFPPGSVFASTLQIDNEIKSSVTYWKAGEHVTHFTAFFHLARSNTDTNLKNPMDVMDVAAVRNVNTLAAVCSPQDLVPVPTPFAPTSVWAQAGLGKAVIARLQNSDGLQIPSSGQLGRLLTFLAVTNSTGAQGIALDTLLAAHVTTAADDLNHATARLNDHVDFTETFRQQCRNNATTCKYEYINVFETHDNVFPLQACSLAEKLRARAWLRVNFGVVHDAGHVDALCALVTEYKNDSPPQKACAVLVNTLKYIDPSEWNLMDPQTTVYSQLWARFRVSHGPAVP